MILRSKITGGSKVLAYGVGFGWGAVRVILQSKITGGSKPPPYGGEGSCAVKAGFRNHNMSLNFPREFAILVKEHSFERAVDPMAEHITEAYRAEFALTGEALTPAVIRVGLHETPVWIQQRWPKGAFASYIRNNGCGHCCTAMAARLHGVMIDPYSEYEHCRRLWGEPSAKQGHWLTTAGIVKVLKSFGVPAQGFGVAQFGTKKATEQILSALEAGKQVIFTSTPDRYPDNPFSTGYHWVMAVSVQENGTVLIANSSEKVTAEGIQFVTPDRIEKALFDDAVAPEDMTWGEPDRIHEGSGFIIV